MKDQNPREEPGVGLPAAAVMNILHAQSYFWLLFGTRFGTAGPRYLGDLRAVAALVFLVLWIGFARSPALPWVFVTALVAQLGHRVASRKYQGHSRFLGESRLSRTRLLTGHLVWCGFGVVLWFVLSAWDAGLAAWCGVSGGAGILSIGFLALREHHAQLDTQDAYHEGAHRGARMQQWQAGDGEGTWQ